ncbi:MAG: AAA family ATPase [Propionibacteriaceae bacterium]|jgi:hypothetical protein|nr:AAA family ATPase [Propionibacteriaceae bacterium]
MTEDQWLPDIPDYLEPLFLIPGGAGDPLSLVGRDSELQQLHEAVSAGGAHVTGERRMGKTWLVKKLQADLEDAGSAIYVSAETNSVKLFLDRLHKQLRRNRMIGKSVDQWEGTLSGKATLNLGFLSLNLTGTLSKSGKPAELDVFDLLSQNHMVLIIDEITHLCHNLGAKAADEFLSDLRARRQSGGLSLVISGSIGLHHALDDFSSVNDLGQVQVGPMEPEDAALLTARLLLGIDATPSPSLVAEIVKQTSGIPFYIQSVVNQMRHRPDASVSFIIDTCLAENTWHTDHYIQRLDQYYGEEKAELALALVDFVVQLERPADVDTILMHLKAGNPDLTVTKDAVIDLLDKLKKDHYLVREGNRDRISSPLLARIWRHHRRLS